MTISRYSDQKLPRLAPGSFTSIDEAVDSKLGKTFDFTETGDIWDFKGKRCGASYINMTYQCHIGAAERADLKKEIGSKVSGGLSAAQSARLDKLNDEQLSRVADVVSKHKDLGADDAIAVNRATEALAGEKAGGKKEGGANLQDPAQAKKYEEFYRDKKDLTYETPGNTDPKVVKATLDQLREELPGGEYTKIKSALDNKGSPSDEQRKAGGWKSKDNPDGPDRGEAVLKSLMDNNFQDVMGEDLSWRQGLQLDHRQAGSTGGKDEPGNWIWISSPTNQAKGGMEAAVKKTGLKGEAAEDFIREGLIGKLNKNASMSSEEVAKAKGAGSAAALAKKQRAAAMRDNLPLMTPAQKGKAIEDASGSDMKDMLKASVASGKNPVTNRNTSYRPVLTGGGADRVRKDYGTVPEMKSLMKMRWDQPLSSADTKNIGNMLKKSTGSKRSAEGKLDEMLGNFPRSSGLSGSDRKAILAAAE